jgi:hypothetical protein
MAPMITYSDNVPYPACIHVKDPPSDRFHDLLSALCNILYSNLASGTKRYSSKIEVSKMFVSAPSKLVLNLQSMSVRTADCCHL